MDIWIESELSESSVKAMTERREKIIYSASDKTAPIGDLVTGMGLPFAEFIDVAHWMSKRQIQFGVRGFATPRYTTLERFLKRKGKERSGYVWQSTGDSKAPGPLSLYAKPPKDKKTLTLKNLKICTTDTAQRSASSASWQQRRGEPIAERHFRGYGRVPEFGLRFDKGIQLLCEFSTKHDVNYSGKIRGKLNGYDECLPKIERDFNARCIVVFILDVPRDRVRGLVVNHNPSDSFRFTDYETFRKVPIGQSLSAPIYIWNDGKEYALTT